MVALLLRIIAQAGETERLLTLHDATVAGVLLVGIIFVTLAFIRGWVVTGAQYRKVCADAERWAQLAWQTANTARSGVQAARDATQTLRQITDNGVTPPAEQQQPMGPYGGPG